jgi:hypothetical protein
VHRFETHSAMALLTFCLPVGLVTYWAFQYLVKTPILEVLPEGAYARWHLFSSPADVRSIRQWVLAACGLLGGAVTHLVWDGFTHENARGIRMIPWLEDPVVDIGTHRLAGVRLLQDGSSLIGLAVVVALVLYGLRRGTEKAVPARPLRGAERRVWVLIYVASAVGLSLAWWLWARAWTTSAHSLRAPTMGVTGMAVAALRGLATGLFCTSLALDWRLRVLRSSTRKSP